MDLSEAGSRRRAADAREDAGPAPKSRRAAPLVLTPEQLNRQFHAPPADASAMKEYAESTMKELFSIYGLNSPDVAEAITEHVPIANFSSGKILESLSTRHLAGAHLQGGSHPPSPPSQPPTPPRTPHSPAGKSSGSPGAGQQMAAQGGAGVSYQMSYHAHGHVQHGDSQAAAIYESIRHKMADSMVKLAGLPPNSLLGNPRAMLPQSMATMLTLAALQEQTKGLPQSAPGPADKPPVNLLAGHRLSPLSPIREGSGSSKSSVPIDYSRYVKRFGSALECGSTYCKDLNYREHFHCLDCNSRVFVKKEEMIRHFKWHKKRDESLQHGFMRYSPMDDCSDRYYGCTHNRKQTHYHCIKEGCDKVYISTSDVQMHANYHRKDSAIIQEGFQRFRATEECRAAYCSFFGQRTTHFHCRRDNCKYTFKNKADMEKHKTYHIKDEQLSRDGFKKFMKHEGCPFESCRFSRVCNHIHCIRAGCNYVLHSSGQLFSHKRKHERQDSEMAYRKFKLAQSMMRSFSEGPQLSPNMIHNLNEQLSQHSDTSASSVPMSVIQQGPFSLGATQQQSNGDNSSDGGNSPPLHSAPPPKYSHSVTSDDGLGSGSLPPQYGALSSDFSSGMAVDLSTEMASNTFSWNSEDFWQKYLARYQANEKCVGGGQCEYIFKEHIHCMAEGCDVIFRSIEGVREHARNHEQQEQVTEAFYITESGLETSNCQCYEDCPYQNREKHYHCTWDNCREIILPSDKPFRRLDHYKMHEYSRKLSLTKDPLTMTHLATSIDGMFRRKRGRPPKNSVIEFPMAPGSTMDSPQAIFTSFKLPKPSIPPGSISNQLFSPSVESSNRTSTSPSSPDESSKSSTPHRLDILQEGFYAFSEGSPCPDALCPYNTRCQHYHCSQPRCFYVTDREDILIMHSKDFHDNIDIMEGFLFFDRMVDCRLPNCHSNKVNRHFHCVRPGCGYSFVRYSTMALHQQKHRTEDNEEMMPEMAVAKRSICSSPPVQNLKMQEQECLPVNMKTETSEASSKPVSPNAGSPPGQLRHQSVMLSVSPDPSANKTTVVKASGTFYPLSAFSCGPGPQSMGKGGVPKSSRGTSPSPPSPTRSDDTAGDLRPNPDMIKLEPETEVQQKHHQQQQQMQLQQQQQQQQQHQQQHSLSHLLQQPPRASHDSSSRPDWMMLERHICYGREQSCSRPFCKLKRKEHYHCNACNQAFSELDKLRPHIVKHSSGALSPPTFKKEPEDNNNDESNDSSANLAGSTQYEHASPNAELPPSLPPPGVLHPSLFPPHSSAAASFNAAMAAAAAAGQQFALITSQGIPFIQPGISAIYSSPAGLMFAAPPTLHPHHPHNTHHPSLASNGLLDHHTLMTGEDMSLSKCSLSPHHAPPTLDMSPEAKKARVQNSMRILKDEPVPEGYVRFRFNEDCKYPHCGYREHQTHFHCMRPDCGYSFCDKTRFVQHTARHERLDTLMGGDFQQFRANVSCGRQECVYTSTLGAMQNKASHFHCLKCDFVCTDTNKVVAHRRQHQKLDSIMAAGFEKFTPSQPCNQESCAHSGKQTHYHCLSCQYAVLGLSQMSAHKYRHME
ncbi:zinc finger protein castor homolog 1 isoform X2 [Bacillus rossius redtenbacheri]|uniref:zinc finger protein castor homolog 1 isoform X2 n=1 Tax=Bacillus rossius redtenbacheri TaxID=93214 RepID=UPI002FDCBD94